jgi:tetratricopeptide (TPR) repeat protein
MRSPLLVLALLLALPASAAKETRKPEPAAPAVPTASINLKEREKVFAAVDEAVRAGHKAQVADLLVEIVNDSTKSAFHAEAWARLGSTFEELDLPYSALIAYERALKANASLVAEKSKAAIALADKVGDTALLEEVFAANLGLEVDASTRSRMAYLAAREAQHQGNMATAGAILKMVQPADPFYPEAKALEGVVLAVQGRPGDALAPLQIAKGAAEKAGRDQRFIDTLNMNLARAYFASGNFARAIEQYALVTRGSRDWPEAQFERAWAHFRLEDVNGTLSLLHNHISPYFGDWFFPEASLLRIHSLFLMCKFPEASAQIDQFRADYTPHVATLQKIGSTPAEELFADMAVEVEKGNSGLPSMITWPFAGEDRFRDSLTAVRRAEDEMARLDGVSANPFSRSAKAWLGERKSALVAAEGKRIQDKARAMEAALSQMLSDAEINKLDMMTMETKLYEMAAAKGKMAEKRETAGRKARVKAGYRTWPWEGEYWSDELGYYRIEATPDCPAGLQTGTQKAP